MAPQSLYSQLRQRGEQQMSPELNLKCSQTLYTRHYMTSV